MSSPLKIEWSQCAENTITPQVWGLWTAYDIWKSAHMIVGSDVVLSRIITENRDPKFTADE